MSECGCDVCTGNVDFEENQEQCETCYHKLEDCYCDDCDYCNRIPNECICDYCLHCDEKEEDCTCECEDELAE